MNNFFMRIFMKAGMGSSPNLSVAYIVRLRFDDDILHMTGL